MTPAAKTPLKITPVRITYLCPLCKAELPKGSDVCKTKGCENGKKKSILVTIK